MANSKVANKYQFNKPNDLAALDLMNAAATAVATDIPEIMFGYGVSDEYSFLIHKSCSLFNRRSSKLVSTVVSTFSVYYVKWWSGYFSEETQPLTTPLPTFDGRAIMLPAWENVRDYFSWRQADGINPVQLAKLMADNMDFLAHINNLYNTAYWNLVQSGGLTPYNAEKELMETDSAYKNELLFKRFNINYNNEPEQFRKGSIMFRDYPIVETEASPKETISKSKINLRNQKGGKDQLESGRCDEPSRLNNDPNPTSINTNELEKQDKRLPKPGLVVIHTNIIRDGFWVRRPWLQTGVVPASSTRRNAQI
ncbi:MAG: tRNA-His guanylyltransferase [Trizodia sp. TS-e1964]|nr:MAG: tRNA-His guanylyltransferase [Trizodia sp. TS-e1964]